MMCMEIILVYTKNHTKTIKENAASQIVTTNDACSYHSALKSYFVVFLLYIFSIISYFVLYFSACPQLAIQLSSGTLVGTLN
jgi:hypothetical protein